MDMEKALENLARRGFVPRRFTTAAEAADYVAASVSGKSVGIGGSVTVESMGLYERLTEQNTVYWHWKEKTPDTFRQAAAAQVYISSANAVAETGEIVNIDGAGNRVAALCYGHETVYIIVGANKLTASLETAIARARNVAAPKNAARLGRKTPCVADGKCHDCRSPERICMAETVLRGKPMSTGSVEVLLIDESLGY